MPPVKRDSPNAVAETATATRVQPVSSSVVAVVVAAVLAGIGGFFAPALIARIPEIEPEPAEPEPEGAGSEPGSAPLPEGDATVDVATVEEPPEPFADIARLPGLGPASAVAAAIAGAIVGLGVDWTWALVLWVPLVPVSVALAVVDWRTRLLPTAVLRPTYVVLLVLALAGWAVTRDTHALVTALLGSLVAYLFFAIFWFIYPRGLGGGDVRLAGVLGLALGWIGWGAVLVGIYSGFLLGGILGGLLALLKIVDRKGVPFGPFMLLGALIGLLWGEPLWSSLLSG